MTKQLLINGLNRNQREGYVRRTANMMEKSVSTKFQTELRKALPGCVLIKHADKSMIGMVDASVTYGKHTVWMEYKCIRPTTKGVNAKAFMRDGAWSPLEVASASPTQFEFAKTLAQAGTCIYLFWVLDHEALRQRIRYVTMWCPTTGVTQLFKDTKALVDSIVANYHAWDGNQESPLPTCHCISVHLEE